MMEAYTLIVNKQQKDLFAKMAEAYAQLHLGQTHDEKTTAKKIHKVIAETKNITIDLAKL